MEFGCHGDGSSMEAAQSRGMLSATMETCLIPYHATSGTHQTAARAAFPNLEPLMAHCIFPEDAVRFRALISVEIIH